jgi:hypothetical protein
MAHALGALDNVVIYVTSELGDPNAHSSVNVPTVLAGGANVLAKPPRSRSHARALRVSRHIFTGNGAAGRATRSV